MEVHLTIKYERFPFSDFLYNYVKISHFGLSQACEENRIPETEGSGRNIFLTKFYARPNRTRNLQVLPVYKTTRTNRAWPHVNMVRLLGARAVLE